MSAESGARNVVLINPAELDMAEVPTWAASDTASLRTVDQLARTLRQMGAANAEPRPATG